MAATRNAAYLLADLLESLEVPPGTMPQTVHGFADEDDVSAWGRHIDHLLLVRNVHVQLDTLRAEGENTSVFMRSLPAWYAGVGMATTPWSKPTGATREACPATDLNMLRALAMVLDHRPRVLIDVDEERALGDVIEEARALLEADEEIDLHVKHYLHALLDRAAYLLAHLDEFGAETLRSVAFELAGALYTRAISEDDPAQEKRWKSAAWGMVGGFMSTSGGEGAKALGRLIAEGVKQIGS